MTTKSTLSVRSSIFDGNSDTKTFVEQSLFTDELVGGNVPSFEEGPNTTEESSLESPSQCPTSDKENVVEDEDSTGDKDKTVNMDTVNNKATTNGVTSISENGPGGDKVTAGQIELNVGRDTSEEKDPPGEDFTSGEPIIPPYGKEMAPINPFNIFGPVFPGFSPPQGPNNEDVKDDRVSLVKQLEGLQPCQLRAISAVIEIARGRYTAMLSPACSDYRFELSVRVESLGFTLIDARRYVSLAVAIDMHYKMHACTHSSSSNFPSRAAKYLAYSAPVLVHFQPQLLSSLQKDGVYRNRFETGSSMGNPKKNPRMLWEVRVHHRKIVSAITVLLICFYRILYSIKPTSLQNQKIGPNMALSTSVSCWIPANNTGCMLKFIGPIAVNDPRGIAHCWNQYGHAYLQVGVAITTELMLTQLCTFRFITAQKGSSL